MIAAPQHPAWLNVPATRDDVHASDQAEPFTFRVGLDTSDEEMLRRAVDPRWLPHISRGVVAWSVTASEIVAVVEHDCVSTGLEPWFIRTLCGAGGSPCGQYTLTE